MKMICQNCNIIMKTGTRFEMGKDGQTKQRRYNRCPNCYLKKYGNDIDFNEILYKEISKCK